MKTIYLLPATCLLLIGCPGGSSSRATVDGRRISWRLTFPIGTGDGLVPFLLDWGDTPSPAQTAPKGCSLEDLRGVHPDPEVIRRMLDAVEVEMPVTEGPRPELQATLRTPRGKITL